MGMNTHIVGFKAPDENWRKMKKAWDTCTEAGVDPPEKVLRFFNYDPPDDAGVVINIEKADYVQKWAADMEDGYVVDIKKLLEVHPDIIHIRFYNSY